METETRASLELLYARRVLARVGAAALLGYGVIVALCGKLVYEVRGDGLAWERDGDGDGDDASGGGPVGELNRAFRKPLFVTLMSFLAMSACLPAHAFHVRERARPRRRRRRRGGRSEDGTDDDDDDASLLSTPRGSPNAAISTRRRRLFDGAASSTSPPPSASACARDVATTCARLTPVAALDLVGVSLAWHGLLRVPASSFLALRHSQLLFAATLAATCALRRLNPTHKLAIALAFASVALVAASTVLVRASSKRPRRSRRAAPCRFFGFAFWFFFFLLAGAKRRRVVRNPPPPPPSLRPSFRVHPQADPESVHELAVGIALVLASQLVNALTLTTESVLLAPASAEAGASLPPMALVGLQGVIGLCLHCVVVLPAAQFLLPGDDVGGCLENTLDSLVMLRTTPHLLAFVAALTASMARDWFPYAPVRASRVVS
jgi:hypothetical protein